MSRFWQHFVTNGRGSRPCGLLGVRGCSVPLLKTVTRRLQIKQTNGVEIWRVERGSPAERGGIREGDILVTLAEEPVVNLARLRKMLKRLPPGFPAEAVLLRGESRVATWVIPGLAAKPARKS
jgi:S1-C subfamily serine protease